MSERKRRKFSIGVNTGTDTNEERWRLKFRQWDFKRPGNFNAAWARE